MPATTGTNTNAALSTMRCTGALLPCASCTILMICARVVFSPICLALMRSLPWLGIVPDNTSSPTRFATGVGSPVIIASSTYAASAVIKLSAWVTTPSTGIFSPARTSMTSPRWIVEIGTSSNCPSATSRAVFGCKPINCLMLAAVPSFAFSSRHLPVRTKVMIITEASK